MNYPCLGGFSSSSWASHALALQVLCTRYLELRPRYLVFSRLETAKQLPPPPAASPSPLRWGTAAPLLHRLRRLQPRTRALAFAPGPLRQAPSPNPRPSQHQRNSTDTTKKRHLHPLLPTACHPLQHALHPIPSMEFSLLDAVVSPCAVLLNTIFSSRYPIPLRSRGH